MKTPTSKAYKKVKLLELKLKQRVRDLFAGGYRSAFKGQGMIFADYRKYVPGDDIRSVSWTLTAKMGAPYIKLFEEEKGATFIIAMDVSGSLDFGSRGFKGESACEIASFIALSAQKNQDAVGLLLFSDEVELYIPPARGPKPVLRLVRELNTFKRKSRQTDLLPALDFLNSVLKKRCHLFLFSDFLLSSDFSAQLKITGKKHDVVAGILQDPLENQFPSLGLMELEDMETGKTHIVNTSSSAFQKAYKEKKEQTVQRALKTLNRSNVDHFFIRTDQDVFRQLMLFLQKRRER